MTIDEVKTYLLLGVKLKRERWKGYIYQEEGKIYKHDGVYKSNYQIELDWLFKPNADQQWGKWEVVNDIPGSQSS